MLKEEESSALDPEHKMILWTLLVALGGTQLLYLNVAAFLPLVKLKNQNLLSDIEVGIILA